MKKKWYSSSTTRLSHILQILSSKGMLPHLPVSILTIVQVDVMVVVPRTGSILQQMLFEVLRIATSIPTHNQMLGHKDVGVHTCSQPLHREGRSYNIMINALHIIITYNCLIY